MKTLLVLFVLAALPAAAQWRRFGDPELRPTGYFGAGVSAPINPVASRLNTGFSLAGGAGLEYRYVGLLVSGTFNDFGLTRTALNARGSAARRPEILVRDGGSGGAHQSEGSGGFLSHGRRRPLWATNDLSRIVQRERTLLGELRCA